MFINKYILLSRIVCSLINIKDTLVSTFENSIIKYQFCLIYLKNNIICQTLQLRLLTTYLLILPLFTA